MKKAILFSAAILLCCAPFTHAALAITDVSLSELYINEEPWIIFYCDSFTVSTDSPETLDSFYIGTRYPGGDMGGIFLYDQSLQVISEFHFLDGQILLGVNPEIIILNDLIFDVTYIGNDSGNEDLWLASVIFWTSPPTPAGGPLVQFNYIPEPTTMTLFALGVLALRKRK